MAKMSLINRDLKRRSTVEKYAAKRAELIAIVNNSKLSDEERFAARLKIQQLPRRLQIKPVLLLKQEMLQKKQEI